MVADFIGGNKSSEDPGIVHLDVSQIQVLLKGALSKRSAGDKNEVSEQSYQRTTPPNCAS
jgi:hypothetical protein